MLERAKEVTRCGKYTYIEYCRFADDLVILVDAHPQHDWLLKAVEKRLREELAKLPMDHVTAYDRMLEQLVQRFGEPAGYARRGKVLIEIKEGESENAAGRKFSIYRWCPAGGDGFHTDCKASVVLSIDPTTGQGTVLYSAPLLWEFANARQTNGYKDDKLFKMLHARR